MPCSLVFHKNETTFIIGSLDFDVIVLQPYFLDDDNMFLPKPITVIEAIGGLQEIKHNSGSRVGSLNYLLLRFVNTTQNKL